MCLLLFEDRYFPVLNEAVGKVGQAHSCPDSQGRRDEVAVLHRDLPSAPHFGKCGLSPGVHAGQGRVS